MRKYNVVVINKSTGNKTIMNAEPLEHGPACVMLSKLTRYKWRVEKLEEI